MSDPEITMTEDGSHTLFLRDIDEHFHSVYGALSESLHIFIGAGLDKQCEKMSHVRILEIGFGTGLNALLTFHRALNTGVDICYMAIEPNPLSTAITSQLNYAQLIGGSLENEAFRLMHLQDWGITSNLSDSFVFQKICTRIQDDLPEMPLFDLVFFDAFSPSVQPEIWTLEVFLKLHKLIAVDGILVTYSSQGAVKRNLFACGFKIEKLPGPKGKREFLRATKQE